VQRQKKEKDYNKQQLTPEARVVCLSPPFTTVHNFVARSLYAPRLKMWSKEFGDQLKVIVSEQFFADPQQTLDELFKFLELEPYKVDPDTFKVYDKLDRVKPSSANNREKMDPSLRDKFQNLFSPFVEELSEFVGEDLGWE